TYDVGYLGVVLRGCDAILADTALEKEHLRQLNLNPEIILAGVGMRLDRFPPIKRLQSRARFGLPDDAFVMLFLGRKTDYKGLDICLEAFARVRRRRQDVFFVAVGPETVFSAQLWHQYEVL